MRPAAVAAAERRHCDHSVLNVADGLMATDQRCDLSVCKYAKSITRIPLRDSRRIVSAAHNSFSSDGERARAEGAGDKPTCQRQRTLDGRKNAAQKFIPKSAAAKKEIAPNAAIKMNEPKRRERRTHERALVKRNICREFTYKLH